MRITRKQIREAIKELSALREDHIDTELDHLKKNIADDLDHIKDLKDDVEDDHEEELRAEKEKAKHESLTRRGRARKIGYHQLRRIIREQNIEIHHHHGDQGYDDREDERLAAEHGGEDDHEQDYQDRRDDAGFEVRHEALKRRLRRIVRENTRSTRRRRR